jgi:hypothetical protein
MIWTLTETAVFIGGFLAGITFLLAIGDCWPQKLSSFLRGERDYFGPWKRRKK